MKAIGDLWTSRDQTEWRDALARYWVVPSVQRNLELERRINKLDSEAIKALAERDWRNFLKEEYFPWKFRGNYVPKRLRDLEQNSLEELFSIKKRLFIVDLADIRGTLRIALEVKGFGPAGASGLLAVIFPRWYGTADKFVVKALCRINSLPERQKVLAMVRMDSKGKETVPLRKKDAALLIDIMRRKASELNALIGTDEWTPRKVDMILWASRDGADPGCLNPTIS